MLSADGEVVRREEGNVNPKLADGRDRALRRRAERLAESETPPFQIDDADEVDELLRLQHRMLDLRREPMQQTLALRHTIIAAMRDYLNSRDFLDVETPILTRSTPEGARDFLVPSRMTPGAWYALPQSPQLFKQLLMMSGYERYYQIARCFRDEDLRGFRQPEFTQLDVEMSFVEEDDVIDLIEGLMARVFEAGGFEVPPPPWPRMPFAEAMLRYGSDKPDVRFGLEMSDLGDALEGTEFKVFAARARLRRRRARPQRGRARAAAQGPRRAHRAGPALRRGRPGVGVRAGGRRLALADRQVPLRGRAGRGHAGAVAASPATCC